MKGVAASSAVLGIVTAKAAIGSSLPVRLRISPLASPNIWNAIAPIPATAAPTGPPPNRPVPADAAAGATQFGAFSTMRSPAYLANDPRESTDAKSGCADGYS